MSEVVDWGQICTSSLDGIDDTVMGIFAGVVLDRIEDMQGIISLDHQPKIELSGTHKGCASTN